MSWFARLSLRQKLTSVYLLAAVTVLLVAGTLLVYKEQSQRRSVFEQRINQQARVVASNISAAVIFEDWQSAREILGGLAADEAVLLAEVLDADGVQQTTIAPDDAALAGSQRPPFSATSEILDGTAVIGTVRVFAEDSEVRQAMKSTIAAVALITLLALFAAVVVARPIQNAVLAPIESLSFLVHEVRQTGDYALRQTPRFPDEIGHLTADINTMLEMIQDRDRFLAEEVALRTRELEQRNQELDREIAVREQAHRDLHASQEQFRRAFDDAPIGMALVGADMRIVRCNAVLNGMAELAGDSVGISIMDLMVDGSLTDLQRSFRALVDGTADAYETEVHCFPRRDQPATCVIGFSAVRTDTGEFLYSVMQVQDVTEARRLSDDLEFQASHDALTGLANRRAFEATLRRLETQRGEPQQYALCLIDLDQFKVVNDTCGHKAGDNLLRQLARVIREQVRSEDLVVRLGGDEFALVLEQCSLEQAEKIANSLRVEIAEFAFRSGDRVMRVGASIGLACGQTGITDTSELLQRVDAACFSAKDAGRNRVYVVHSDDAALERKQGEMHWVHRLQEAIAEDQFVLFAQPVVPLNSRDPIPRYEILIRLRDFRNRRLIPPGAFLPAAERYGISTQIDRWVVRNVVTMLHVYRDLFSEDASYWINLAGSSVSNGEFLKFLERTVSAADLPPGRLNFEITETELIENLNEAASVMERMKEFGCQFALDDFGTGLSSFSYLKSLPVDYIKIDGVFVRDIVDDEVDRIFVKSIIDIAHTMNIRCITEFVESERNPGYRAGAGRGLWSGVCVR